MGNLYVVATPIGNLEDITLRALRVLREADLIACEDTRTTRKLCARHDIKTKLISFFQHSRPEKIQQLITELNNGRDIALVSEAGTPCISDPGTLLVSAAVEAGISVIPIPGACAVTAAASASGLPVDKFSFYGFLPRKKGRQKIIAQILDEDKTAIFYESPHRIIKTLEQIVELEPSTKIVLAKELTKKFEQILRGSVTDVLAKLKEPDKVKGEIVVIINQKNA
ncbi:16S rRNA (cytidine(1402)-2'-O)-methyltransferase [Patescibacteria group bacterium]